MKQEMKRYDIEYTLSNGDWCSHVFEGINKTDAIKNYNRKTGIPKSKITSVEEIPKDVTELSPQEIHNIGRS